MQYTDKFDQPIGIGDYICTVKHSTVTYGKIVKLTQRSATIQSYHKGNNQVIPNPYFNWPGMTGYDTNKPHIRERYIMSDSLSSLENSICFLKTTKNRFHKEMGKHSELIKVSQIQEEKSINIKGLMKINI